MAEESFQEKTEQATPKRREDARRKGQVARSTELSSVAILMAGFLSIWWLSGYMNSGLQRMMVKTLSTGHSITLDALTISMHLMGWIIDFVAIVTPIVLLLVFVAMAINIAQVGVLFSTEPLSPKGERISPLKGIKKILSKRSLVELAKGLFKVAVVAYVTYTIIDSEADTFVRFVDLGISQIMTVSGDLVLQLTFTIIGLLLLMAILDFAFQRWDHEKNLRMTRQELKEELKQQEGDPILSSRIRSLQRDLAQRRMMSDVEGADVVVANPVHVAVALKYDPVEMAAPLVVAKGQRLVAQKIKDLARQTGVPIVENKPLARALFKAVQVGEEIPENLFRATAEVLAFVFQLRRRDYAENVQ